MVGRLGRAGADSWLRYCRSRRCRSRCVSQAPPRRACLHEGRRVIHHGGGNPFVGVACIAVLLLVISVGLVFPRALVESGRFIYNNRGSLDATLEWLSQTVDLPAAFPSVHRDGGSIAIRDAAVWLAVAIGVHALVTGVRKRSIAIKWAVGSLALAFALMIGASIVWSLPWRHGRDRGSLEAGGIRRVPAVVAPHDGRHQRGVVRSRKPNFSATWPSTCPDVRLAHQSCSGRRLQGSREHRINRAGVDVRRAQRSADRVAQAEDLHDDRSAFRLRLPVAVQSLNFLKPGEVPEDGPMLIVTPIASDAPSTRRNAVRATRYGHARAFFFDDWAYPETRRFLDARERIGHGGDRHRRRDATSGLPITITAGAVPTTIRLSIGKWEESFSLAAGQKQDVVLPPAERHLAAAHSFRSRASVHRSATAAVATCDRSRRGLRSIDRLRRASQSP